MSPRLSLLILVFNLVSSPVASAQYTCNKVMPYSNMQYLSTLQLAQYKLTNPCSFVCLPNYYGDFCAPIPAVSTVPKGPWNVAGYYASNAGVVQTMTLSLSSTLSQICFTGVDNLLIGLANQDAYNSALVLISLSTRQQTPVTFSTPTGYTLDALQVRYGQVFVGRSQQASGPYDISILTGPLQAGPYSFTTHMPISVRATLIEVSLDKGMNTTFVYSTRNSVNTLYACYPNGVCSAWWIQQGVTGVVCGMDCPNAVYASVQNSIWKVTSTAASILVSNGVSGLPGYITCMASIPSLNTILFRTNSDVQQVSIGTSKSTVFGAVPTLTNSATSCTVTPCCSLDASDSNSVIMLAENGIVRTVEAQQQACGYGATSLPIVSTPNASLCFPCPSAPANAYLITNNPACAWQCNSGYYSVGSQCVLLPQAPCPAYFTALPWGQCQPSVMPWAPTGAYLNSVNISTTSIMGQSAVLLSGSSVAVYPPYILAAAGGVSFMGMSRNLFAAVGSSNRWQVLRQVQPQASIDPCTYSTVNDFYYLNQQGGYLWAGFTLTGTAVTHCLWALNVSTLVSTKVLTSNVTQAYRWTLGSTVCSVSSDQVSTVFVLPCGSNYLLQSKYTPTGFSILAGQMKAGYLDGALQTALFNAPTSIAFYSQRIYVTDTNNCVIRELDLVRNTVSTVAGQAGVCQRQDGFPSGLRFPVGLSLSAYDGFFLFREQSQDEQTATVRQFHSGTGYVATLGVSQILGATTLLGYTDRIRVMSNSSGQFYDLVASPLACPAGTMSLEGNAMSAFQCDACGLGFYSNTTLSWSKCEQCSAVSCTKVGQRPVLCGANFDSYCGNCTNLPAGSPAVYTGPAQSYDDWTNCPWVYIPPCPVGFYKNQSACLACPAWSTTSRANATNISACACASGHWATDAKGGTVYACIIPSPYKSMPGQCQPLTQCQAFTQPAFPFPLISSCSSAAVDSVYGVCACQPGEYIAQVYPKQCQACPSYLYSPSGQSCQQCPPYAEPSLDGSACRCAGGTQDVALITQALQCVCLEGHGFGAALGCYACPVGTYGPTNLTLSLTPWQQTQACLPCPLGFWSASGQAQCTACPAGAYRDLHTQGCAECPNGQYAPDPTTKACTDCRSECGGLLQTPCPTNSSLFICRECPPKRSNADLNGNDNCATSCWQGYYEMDLACVPCTGFNATTCPAGNFLEQCGAYNDANCAPCINASMPLYNAVWVSGNPDPQGPSLSCAWQCAEGYKPKVIAWAGTPYAVWSCEQARAWSVLDMFSF